MAALTTRHQLLIGIALIALMALTRGHHFYTAQQVLPSASWAVFFLAGVYLRPAWTFPALFGVAALLDAAAIGWAGVSAYCLSPAYVALIPAYGALWLAGCWYAARHAFRISTLVALAIALLASVAACELISHGSFYFLSGRFADPTLAHFAERLVTYGPYYLTATAFWIGVATVVHAAVAAANGDVLKATRT